MGQAEYEKVLLLDIDTLVIERLDSLFELPAPAAMRRGVNHHAWKAQHGKPIDGCYFFRRPVGLERLEESGR